MCHYQPWEDDSSATSEEDEEPIIGNNNHPDRPFILPFRFHEWESRLDRLEEHIARIGAQFDGIQERMLFLQRALRVVSAMFLATLAYALYK